MDPRSSASAVKMPSYYPPQYNFPQPISTMQQPGIPQPPLVQQPMQHQHQPVVQQSIPPAPLQGLSLVKDGRRYTLVVVQQPQRARMCGFGDKDRRPITPPPCIKLIITDANTNREIELSEIDPSFFVLSVSLWDSQASSEVSLTRASSTSPAASISAATLHPYPPPPERPYLGLLNPTQMNSYWASQQAAPTGYPQQHFAPYMNAGPPGAMAAPSGGSYMAAAQTPVPIAPMHASGMFTRNLIGSLAVNAAKLNDDKNKVGLWFVLQDLSVRTEGVFRLHMRFVDVSSSMDNDDETHLNTNDAPVLASCFSDSFQVYSAKKFPGVVESTPLSRAFATQGIKIPIRKDAKIANQSEYDADDK